MRKTKHTPTAQPHAGITHPSTDTAQPPAPPSLRTPAEILAMIEKTVHNTIRAKCQPETARLLIYACQTASTALRTLVIDQQQQDILRRLDALERERHP